MDGVHPARPHGLCLRQHRHARRRPLRRRPARAPQMLPAAHGHQQQAEENLPPLRRICPTGECQRESRRLAPADRIARDKDQRQARGGAVARHAPPQHDLHHRLLRRHRRQQRGQPPGRLRLHLLHGRTNRHARSLGHRARRLQPRTRQGHPRGPALRPGRLGLHHAALRPRGAH